MTNLLSTAEKVKVAREIESAKAVRQVGRHILRNENVTFGLWRRATDDTTVQVLAALVQPRRDLNNFGRGVPGAHVMVPATDPANMQRIRFADYDHGPESMLITSTFGSQVESRIKTGPAFSFHRSDDDVGCSNNTNNKRGEGGSKLISNIASIDTREYPATQTTFGKQVLGGYRTTAALTMAKTARFPPAH